MPGHVRPTVVQPLAVEVARRDRSVLERSRREQVLRIAVLLNEVLGDDPEDFGPDFADGVDAPITGESRVLYVDGLTILSIE